MSRAAVSLPLAEGTGVLSPLVCFWRLGVASLTSCKCAVLAHRFADFGTGPIPPKPNVMLPEPERCI